MASESSTLIKGPKEARNMNGKFKRKQIAWAWINEAAASSKSLTQKEAMAGAEAYLLLKSVGLEDLHLKHLTSLPEYLRDAAKTYAGIKHKLEGPKLSLWRHQVLQKLDEGGNRATKG